VDCYNLFIFTYAVLGGKYQISFRQRTREASVIYSDKRERLAHPGHYPRPPPVLFVYAPLYCNTWTGKEDLLHSYA